LYFVHTVTKFGDNIAFSCAASSFFGCFSDRCYLFFHPRKQTSFLPTVDCWPDATTIVIEVLRTVLVHICTIVRHGSLYLRDPSSSFPPSLVRSGRALWCVPAIKTTQASSSSWRSTREHAHTHVRTHARTKLR
jgi:hypothetical protein